MQNSLFRQFKNGLEATRQIRHLTLLGGLLCLCTGLALAQVPLPGNQTTIDVSPSVTEAASAQPGQAAAPLPGAAPVPGQWQAAAGKAASAYQQLPLTQSEAEMRVQDLKAAMAATPPSNIQESLFQLGEWLADMADAHSKMAQAFGKHDTTRGEAQLERLSAQKFNMLKNQIQLLKAELLIRQHRYPEALQPLVDIVVAEPQSATGLAAYQHLREIGFSQVVPAQAPSIQAAPPVKHEDKIALPKTGGEAFTNSAITETSAYALSKFTSRKVALPKANTTNGLANHNLKKAASNTITHTPIHSAVTNKLKAKSIAGVIKPAPKVWISGTPIGR